MDLFWNLILAYLSAGAFFSFWYRKEIKMHVGLMITVYSYDAWEGLTEDQLLMILSTIYMIIMCTIWPVMISQLENLK